MPSRKPAVAHILPSFGLGGVEVAVASSAAKLRMKTDYRLFYVKSKGGLELGQESVWTALKDVIVRRWVPDVVVTSLYASHVFGFILSLTGIRWAAFFHSAGFGNTINKTLNLWAWKRADVRLVDSGATATFMAQFDQKTALIVPHFILGEITRPNYEEWRSREFDLVWVGRNAKAKRPDLVVDFVSALKEVLKFPKVLIVSGDEVPDEIRAIALDKGIILKTKTRVNNTEMPSVYRSARFSLSVSDREGMSMTVIEAIANGSIPVARPVGQIESHLDGAPRLKINDVSRESFAKVACHMGALMVAADAYEPLVETLQRNIRPLESYHKVFQNFLLEFTE